MKFLIEGANAKTGVNQAVVITAPDEATARSKAKEHGLSPSSCKVITDPVTPKTEKAERVEPPTSKPTSKRQGISSFQGTIIIILLLVGIGFPCFGWFKPTPQWEYTIQSPSDIEFEQKMNSLGADGWEMVFARRATSGDGSDVKYEVILKRPKTWYLLPIPSPRQ